MLAIETEALTKDYFVGFWRPRPVPGARPAEPAGRARRGVRFPRSKWRRQEHRNQAADAADLSDQRARSIFGRPAGDLDVKRRLGFLPENPSFYDYLTAEELLDYFGRLFGMSAPDRKARIAEVLDEVGIGKERRLRLRSYSKGMVQRVGIAQAILNRPEIVFLDEPMSGLDPLGRRDVRQLMLGLRDRGCTVFFSSHILSDAETLCSQVGIVAQGRLVAGGRLSELLAFETKGWELVVDRVSEPLLAALRARARHLVAIDGGRYTAELPPDPPDQVLRELSAAGAQVLSLNPVRDTLESFFVEQVAATAARDTSRL